MHYVAIGLIRSAQVWGLYLLRVAQLAVERDLGTDLWTLRQLSCDM